MHGHGCRKKPVILDPLVVHDALPGGGAGQLFRQPQSQAVTGTVVSSSGLAFRQTALLSGGGVIYRPGHGKPGLVGPFWGPSAAPGGWGRFGPESAAAFSASFFSGILANTMLMSSYQDGKLNRRELTLSYLLNTGLPGFVLHLPTTFFILVPLTRQAGLIYLGLNLLAALLRTDGRSGPGPLTLSLPGASRGGRSGTTSQTAKIRFRDDLEEISAALSPPDLLHHADLRLDLRGPAGRVLQLAAGGCGRPGSRYLSAAWSPPR